MTRLFAAILLLLAGMKDGAADTMLLRVGGGDIRIMEEGEKLALGPKAIEDWIRKSAEAVSVYFGRFPIPQVDIVVVGEPGAGVSGGRTQPSNPITISAFVGAASASDDLMHADWVMVHEMIHTGLPWLPRRNSWFHEGVAVYVESIARVQAGHLTQETVLRDFIRQMPRGQADPGGFETSRSWAVTYWGGALFCLAADVEIHRRTEGKRGLQDALRAINHAGHYGMEGRLADLLAIGDKATGTSVLADLYARSARSPVDVDLDRLWKSLGVGLGADGTVELDDTAPEASVRSAIFARRRHG